MDEENKLNELARLIVQIGDHFLLELKAEIGMFNFLGFLSFVKSEERTVKDQKIIVM